MAAEKVLSDDLHLTHVGRYILVHGGIRPSYPTALVGVIEGVGHNMSLETNDLETAIKIAFSKSHSFTVSVVGEELWIAKTLGELMPVLTDAVAKFEED